MIDDFSFLQKELIIPILLGGLVVFNIYVWKEWQTKQRGRFVVNAIVALITILALAMLILEPTKEVEINDSQALVLTDNFDEVVKDSLLNHYKSIKVLDYNPKKSIRKELDSLTNVIVLGDGVKPYDFYLFDSIPTAYIPNGAPTGVTRLNYTEQLVLGNELKVSGSYSNPIEKSFLVLQDSRNNGLDSIQFVGDKNADYNLSTHPKVSGTYVYQLAVKDSTGSVLETNPLPIKVLKKEPLRVLILNTFPTFETKYLKNFLAESGHEVIVRSQLTKGKYKFEYFNTPTQPIYQFTKETLESFDIVIVDAETYTGLRNTIRKRFETSIEEQGLGLFIQPSDFLFNSRSSDAYFKFKNDRINTVKLPVYAAETEKYPYQFNEQLLVEPIHLGGTSNLAAYRQIGNGKIATTTLLNSYQFLLNGKTEVYHGVWTTILDKIAKKKGQVVSWQSNTKFPRIDEPFQFEIRTNLEEFSIINEDSISVSLVQSVLLPSHYSGTVYPKKTGWNSIQVENDSTSFSYYVFEHKDWKALKSTADIAANKNQFEKETLKNRTVVLDRPVSLLVFYILFLLGVGWLWLSPKLSAEG
ncbi:hypothetical protein CLV90_3357 [Maribacter spongiicola]|uniref:Uncharacterized protein n=1 Tax=Maribacter spongiicola TaxID=1206753 RepID=A0A4V3EQ52_9FLAO|nr:hypothetical protein [Maribacter spongiicola]TDT40508.1 hypothetical protein CLV90_3357 [Maribacter spongiicola]